MALAGQAATQLPQPMHFAPWISTFWQSLVVGAP
jgi:hypothetical protein